MGFATHLGPWLLGTVKETTGTSSTLGQVRNTGLTLVAQTVKLNMVGATSAAAISVCTLPAGAHITSVVVDTLTTLSGTVTAAVLTIGEDENALATINQRGLFDDTTAPPQTPTCFRGSQYTYQFWIKIDNPSEEYFKDFNPIYIAGDLDEVTITTYPKYAGEINMNRLLQGSTYFELKLLLCRNLFPSFFEY